MPTDRPTAAELLEAIRTHLLDNVMPLLDGQPAFHLRVAVNALAIVERTMKQGDAMDQAELQSLRTLLEKEGDLLELNELLSTRIRAGKLPDPTAVLTHLRETALDKLRLANPRYLVPRDHS
jgi:hypothetical protein